MGKTKSINLNFFDRLFEGRVWGLNKGRKHFSMDNRSCYMFGKLSIAGRESSLRSVVSRPVVDNLIHYISRSEQHVVLAARGRRSAAFC